MFLTYSTTYIIISITYSLTIYWLFQKLNKITTEGLIQQKKSIKKQFWVFIIAFTFKLTYYLSQVFMNKNDYFLGAFIGGTINIIWNSFPITYMLLEHHKTFRTQLDKRDIANLRLV